MLYKGLLSTRYVLKLTDLIQTPVPCDSQQIVKYPEVQTFEIVFKSLMNHLHACL